MDGHACMPWVMVPNCITSPGPIASCYIDSRDYTPSIIYDHTIAVHARSTLATVIANQCHDEL